jgi:hypothetical protein
MNKLLLIIGFVFGFIITSSSQNVIVAGQTTGTNIHYTDYQPDSSIYLGQNNDGFMLDIDDNGTYDLLFNIGEKNWLPNELWTWSTVQILSENVKICLNDMSSKWIDKLEMGDTISLANKWSLAVDTLYYLQQYSYWAYPPPGGESSDGEYGAGYMGFQMNFPDETLFGWINVEGGKFTLTSKEKAICGLTVGTSKIINSDNLFRVYPNPFNDQLTIESFVNNRSGMKIEIINAQGIIVKSVDIQNEKSWINTSLLTPGIYLIRIKDGDNVVFTSRTLKI